jgi:ATP-binding cassette subfamily C protein LapB
MKKTSWHQIDTHYLPKHDSLLSCLVLLTRFFQNPYSSKTLCARLPLVNNKLTKELLPRAAARAKLKVTEVDEGLDKLKDENHPSILCLKNGNYALLIQDESGAHKILHTDDPKTLQDVSTLKKNDLVSAFTVEPEYQNTHRSGETLSKDKKNWFWKVMIKSWPTYTEVLAASFLVNIFALVVPLFTMNVYDRVVPNNALDTMWVLASGVGLVFFFDILLKTLRSYFIDMANKRSDQVLSANIFHQVLGVNMTARPKSIGGLANSVQSYEIFRDFITSTTMTAIVDLPFCLLFLFIIYLVGGSIVIIPAIMVPLVFGLGFLLQIPLIRLTKEGYKHSSEKQATLIESLNNIEAVKTSSAESLLQSKWEQLIHLSAKNNHKLKFISNLTINITLLSQQLAYIGIVIFGVYKISEGEMTTGALIACTMLAGRALAPLSQVAKFIYSLLSIRKCTGISRQYHAYANRC